tara:strand:+ start:38953 stop:39813 length:861 start_codon:yes stop_codon:yes gene_type:complete
VYKPGTLLFILIIVFTQSSVADGLSNQSKKFTPPSKISKSDWSDLNEIKRTWDSALVRIPKSNGYYSSHIMSHLTQQPDANLKTFPTVIYLHGCAGVWEGTYTRINFLARSGFAVIAPVSFARAKYPQSCDPASAKGGMYRGTLSMRQNDAGYAIAKARQLDWVDNNNVFLMGHSQGGITTATFKPADETMSVNARIIEGWTCHAGWSEYRGINAPDNEPVLAIVASNDPWFQNHWTRGSCSTFIKKENGSRSIVLSEGELNASHELLEDQNLQKIVIDFMHTHMR